MKKKFYYSHYRKKESKKPTWQRILTFSLVILIFDRILFYSFLFITSKYDTTYISFIQNIINPVFTLVDIIFYISIIFIIISVIEYFKTKKEINDNKYLIFEIILFFLGTPILAVFVSSYYNVISNNLFYGVIIFISGLFQWILKIFVFFGAWILVILILLIKSYYKFGKFKYKLFNFEINSHAIIFGRQHRRIRGVSILEIKNIPRNISSRENRIMKKNIERITFGDQQVYFHYHLTVLLNYVPELSYEISIHKNRVRFRIILTFIGKNKNELITELKNILEIISRIYETSFPGLSFEILYGNKLRNAWSEIFGGIGDYNIKTLKNNILKISQLEKDIFLKIIKIKNRPQVKAYLKRTQIDSFISSILSSNVYGCNFVVHLTPVNIFKFQDNQFPYQSFSNNFQPININKNNTSIRENLLSLRHSEITAIWKISAYIVLRSLNEDQIENESKKITAILDTVFSGNENSIETEFVKKSRLIYCLSLIINRQSIGQRIIMTSGQLATYLHLPEESFPSIERSNIPLFEIPTEDLVNEKITIGTILFQDNKELFNVGIDIEDLRLNMFITGLIGMGKTSLVMNILKKLNKYYSNINWLVLDWKGDYAALIKEAPGEILILRPGTDEAPFQINMFNPENANSEEHARKLFALVIELFKSDFQNKPELSVQMERVCRDVIYEVTTNENKRSLEAFFEALKDYQEREKINNRTISMTVNALINRFERFRSGNLKKVFDVKNSNIDFNTIVNKKVIFDFNYLLSKGGTKQDVRFLMNLVLKYVIDKALQRGISNELNHIVIIEDAQLLVPAVLREVPETSMGEDIPLLLRGVGESMITIATRPEISPDIISNSGIKVSFKSPYDSKKIANYQNLNQEQEEYLKIMPKQEAIITIPGFQYPFRIKSENVYFQKCSDQEIIMNNKSVFPDLYKNYSNKLHNNFEQNIELEIENYIEKISEILKNGPKNKFEIAKSLNIGLEQVEPLLTQPISNGTFKSSIFPVFSNGKLQKIYSLNDPISELINVIKAKIEIDFVRPGTFGYTDNKLFDYIMFSQNIYIKIYVKNYKSLDEKEFSKIISDLITEAYTNNMLDIILIIPYSQWKNKILKWFNEWNIDTVHVFAFNKFDWNKFRQFIQFGEINEIKDDHNSNNFPNKKITTPSIKNMENHKNNSFKSNIKQDYNKFLSDILSKFNNLFPTELLIRFGSDFPTEIEVSEYLGCDINDIMNNLNPIRRYVKEIRVHDFDEPTNVTHIYYGWRDIINGKAIIKNNLIKIFNDNDIPNKILESKGQFSNNISFFDISLPKHSIYINIIYDTSDLANLKERLITGLTKNPNFTQIIIIYSIELKNNIEKKLNNWGITDKVEVLRFDWSDIDPWIRNLRRQM
ncbi:MAG: ATP-binding protein [Candidatus Helarchaeota archaeon]